MFPAQQVGQVQDTIRIEAAAIICDFQKNLICLQLSADMDFSRVGMFDGIITGFLHDAEQVKFHIGFVADNGVGNINVDERAESLSFIALI